jgi:hypothetical protein
LVDESDKATYWERKLENGESLEVLVPRRNDFADFTARISEALSILEVAESRSQLEILDDLNTANADVVRIRTHARDGADDGSIALEDGVLLCEKVRELVVAAACAATDKKSVFSNRKPDQAISYLRKVRLGQTERGSYVFTLISPVTPSLTLTPGQLIDVKEPFEREVMQTLARSLDAALKASQSSGQTGRLEPFSDAIKLGVNANLLEAVVGLSEGSGNQDVEVRFSWSHSREMPPPEIPRRIAIPQDVIPVIKEAARVFRETSPQEDFILVGTVVTLSSEDPESKGGKISVLGFVEDKARKVAVVLPPPEYRKAIKAHEEGLLVSCYGELIKEKGVYVLQNPRKFEIDEG